MRSQEKCESLLQIPSPTLHAAMDWANAGTAWAVVDTLTFLAFLRINNINISALAYGFVRAERLAFSAGRANICYHQGHRELLLFWGRYLPRLRSSQYSFKRQRLLSVGNRRCLQDRKCRDFALPEHTNR